MGIHFLTLPMGSLASLDVSFSLHVWLTFLLASTPGAGELLWCGL